MLRWEIHTHIFMEAEKHRRRRGDTGRAAEEEEDDSITAGTVQEGNHRPIETHATQG